jgi:hypothetical protein
LHVTRLALGERLENLLQEAVLAPTGQEPEIDPQAMTAVVLAPVRDEDAVTECDHDAWFAPVAEGSRPGRSTDAMTPPGPACQDRATEDVHSGAARRPGTPLTAHEHALLERICAGTWPGAAEARAQLASARWGGKDHDGDACFLIDVAPGRLPVRRPADACRPQVRHARGDASAHRGPGDRLGA